MTRMTTLRVHAALFCVFLSWLGMDAAHAALHPGISGAWYNPPQSGHGFTIEILDQDRALAFWYVYDPAGNPVHLYIEGEVEGNEIVGTAYFSRGMRFGRFDPAEHRLQTWGTLSIAFSSCDAATLRWDANGPAGAGYGSGVLPLQRLTRIADVGCQFPLGQSELPVGLYSGTWDRASGGDGQRPYPLQAFVDRAGRLWAAAEWSAGPTFVRSFGPAPSFIGAPATRNGDRVEARVTVRSADALSFDWPEPAIVVPVSFSIDAAGSASATAATSAVPFLVERFAFARSTSAHDPLLDADFDQGDLSGRQFRASTIGQFFLPEVTVRFLADGSFCIDSFQPCQYRGRVGEFEPGMTAFAFTLDDTRTPGEHYEGKAWLRRDTRQLVLVGAADDRGLGLVANEVASP